MVDTPFRKISDDIGDAVKGSLHRAGEDAAHYSEKARRMMDKTSHRASDMLGDFAEETRVRGQKAANYAVREVREHPMATVAIGVALGAAITALLLSRRR